VFYDVTPGGVGDIKRLTDTDRQFPFFLPLTAVEKTRHKQDQNELDLVETTLSFTFHCLFYI